MNTKEIKKRMIDRDIEMSELAEIVGVSQQHLSDVIRRKKPLTLKMANKLQKALEIPNSDFVLCFLEGDDER